MAHQTARPGQPRFRQGRIGDDHPRPKLERRAGPVGLVQDFGADAERAVTHHEGVADLQAHAFQETAVNQRAAIGQRVIHADRRIKFRRAIKRPDTDRPRAGSPDSGGLSVPVAMALRSRVRDTAPRSSSQACCSPVSSIMVVCSATITAQDHPAVFAQALHQPGTETADPGNGGHAQGKPDQRQAETLSIRRAGHAVPGSRPAPS